MSMGALIMENLLQTPPGWVSGVGFRLRLWALGLWRSPCEVHRGRGGPTGRPRLGLGVLRHGVSLPLDALRDHLRR